MPALSSEDCARISRIFLAKRDLIYRYARRYLKDEQLIEDVVQDAAECFSRNYERIAYMSEDALCGYLYGIAKNKVFKLSRRKSRFSPLHELENIPGPHNVEETVFGRIAAQEVFRHIEELPPHYAFFIKMAYLDGLEPALIARVLEVKPDSLRMIAHRAKKHLAELCRKERIQE